MRRRIIKRKRITSKRNLLAGSPAQQARARKVRATNKATRMAVYQSEMNASKGIYRRFKV